jgi:hypothetical protein
MVEVQVEWQKRGKFAGDGNKQNGCGQLLRHLQPCCIVYLPVNKLFRNITNSFSPTPNETSGLLDTFIQTEETLRTLPALTPLERVKFDHDVAIDHLYYSSKIEGTNLNKERLEKATRP